MLLMFAVGVGNLGWMLVLGAVMAVEKNLPWGRRVSAPLGVGLLCGGLTLGLQRRARVISTWALTRMACMGGVRELHPTSPPVAMEPTFLDTAGALRRLACTPPQAVACHRP